MTEQAAFQVLASLTTISRQSAKGLPAQEDVAPRWSGVGFSFLGFHFVTPIGQVAELLEVPPSTRLPGVHSWVVGLSNVRGRLLPLFDLSMFFGGKLAGLRKQHRVLVVETDKLYSGLLVDRAFGMQHFSADSFIGAGDVDEALPEVLQPYVQGAYQDGAGRNWLVFDVAALIEEPRFVNAALG
jgi:twitching motility protein PilI